MKNYEQLFDTSVYSFDGSKNILEEKDIGIAADIASMLTPESSVFAMKCFQGCPYTNTAFDFDIRVDGEKLRANNWHWLPNAILRLGETDSFSVRTVTAVVPKMRSVVQKIVIRNKTNEELELPVTLMFRGKTRKEDKWKFPIPKPEKLERESYDLANGILSLERDGAAYRLTPPDGSSASAPHTPAFSPPPDGYPQPVHQALPPPYPQT